MHPPSTAIQRIQLTPQNNLALSALCGPRDSYLREIEQDLGVTLYNRGHDFQILGPQQATSQAIQLLTRLYHALQTPHQQSTLSLKQVRLYLKQSLPSNKPENAMSKKSIEEPFILQTPRKLIKPKSQNQINYLACIAQLDINFGIGPAGTGKTYLAIANAVVALEKQQVNRIVLVRPAVEAGEKLGFLPGDLNQKLDPYFQPLYDALYEMIGFNQTMRFIESHIIEIVPLAYMRGRTLNGAFVILDEAQNTTQEQMKMFLTRIGLHTKVVISGDITQTDLPKDKQSGVQHCLPLLEPIKAIGFTYFNTKDIIRHQLIKAILKAYEENPTASKV